MTNVTAFRIIIEKTKNLFLSVRNRVKVCFSATVGFAQRFSVREKMKKFVGFAMLFAHKTKQIKPWKKTKKALKRLSDSWKIVLGFASAFLFFYYIIGSLLSENIDIEHVYRQPQEKNNKSEMVKAMAFLINREIDEKMWTPNLPLIFPASILDNMPNFQIGIIKAVRDNTIGMLRFVSNTEQQNVDLKTAKKFLDYSPSVWLMSKQGAFSLAPSSNAQYRKARKELQKFNGDADFAASADDFAEYLGQLSLSLQKVTRKNEEYVQEHASDFFDLKADDTFYFTRGYVFGVRQIAEAAGFDFKEAILRHDVYTEWTHFLSSLQKIIDFAPCAVRNAKLDSQTAPNHLMVQNYFLQRALAAIERIRYVLTKENKYAV